MLPELWNIIFEMSDNKELMILKQVSKHFIIEPILKTRRLNYPRIGHCKIHEVPFQSDYFNSNPNLILKYLYYHVDLVKGDIVTTGNHTNHAAIYDGYQLIGYFYSWHDPDELHPSFDIIKDKVPFDYWCNQYNVALFDGYTINIEPYLNQCIENIKINTLDDIVKCHDNYKEDRVLYTTFKTDKEYIIIGRICNAQDDDILWFKNKLLEGGSPIPAEGGSPIPKMRTFYLDSNYGPNTLMIDTYN